MKRRAVLTGISSAAGAAASSIVPPSFAEASQSEIVGLYADWGQANAVARHLAEARSCTDIESDAEREAQRRAEHLRARLMVCQPQTLPEIAAMLHVLWDTLGFQPDEPDTFWNGGAPSVLASIWRGASGGEGVPSH